MPVEITKSAEVAENTNLDALLVKDGQPTLEAKVLGSFLESIDFGAILDDEDVVEFVEGQEAVAKTSTDEADIELVDGATTVAEGQEFVIVETLDGEVASEMVDEDDLCAMFEHFVRYMPESTFQEKTEKALAINLLGEDFANSLDEASVFKKGDFRKLHSGAKKTPAARPVPSSSSAC